MVCALGTSFWETVVIIVEYHNIISLFNCYGAGCRHYCVGGVLALYDRIIEFVICNRKLFL